MSDEQECRGCRFFAPGSDDWEPGRCRRFPPRMVAAVGMVANSRYPYDGDRYEVGSSVRASYPDVGAGWWCGEWRAP